MSTSVYYIRSAQQQNSRANSKYRNVYENKTYYEVRLTAWTCSCPAFAFSAFPATDTRAAHENKGKQGNSNDTHELSWLFGGLTLGTDMPVCKHLLACTLVEHCAPFSAFVEERQVSLEELAGWAAGWGD